MITAHDLSAALAKAGCGIMRRPMLIESKPAPVFQAGVEPSLQSLLLTISGLTGLSVLELKSHRRNRELVRGRAIFYWAARRLTSKTFPQIGRFCGNRDHSTVMHGIGRVDDNRSYYEPELTLLVRTVFSATEGGK